MQTPHKQSVPDAHFDLIAALYELTRSERDYRQYALEAEHRQDRELTTFFSEVREQHRRLAEQAKTLLLERLGEKEVEETCGSYA